MVVRRQGCRGAGTARQATTTATPARLRPSPTPAAAAARSLHHGTSTAGRAAKQRTQRVPPEQPRANTTTVTPRFAVEPRHNGTHTRTLLRHYTLPASGRSRKLRACVLTLLPSHKHRLIDITIGYLLTPPLPLSTQATSSS
jgi:hypothetical protein